MAELSAEGRRIVGEVAVRHGVSAATAEALLSALLAGGGSQAQFNLPELGGMGQWSRGGMVMVGDMFNNALKARVDALCSELAGLAGVAGTFAPAQAQSQSQGGGASLFVAGSGGAGGWWPAELGTPSSTGAQNDMRYAFFPAAHRLAIGIGRQVTVYDTGDHRLGGFSQQQSGDRSLSFTSQHGLVRVADLEVVAASKPATEPARPAPRQSAAPASPSPPEPPRAPGAPEEDVFGKIERLADLHARGILTPQEFEAKKSELLGRL
jgi:hypothetical protein